MKKALALLIILLLVFGMATVAAYATLPPGHDCYELGCGGLGHGEENVRGTGVEGEGEGHGYGYGHIPEFPLVALPGIVGFAGLALVWLKRFFYR